MIKLLLTFILLALPLARAQAQDSSAPTTDAPKVINQYDEKYKVKPIIVRTNKRNDLIPKNEFGVYFVRDDKAAPGEATLRLATPLSVNGCINVDQPPPVVTEEPPYLRVFVENPSIRLNKDAAQKQASCREPPTFLYSDVTLNRDNLIAKGITKITLRNALLSDTYIVNLDNQHIMLVPETQNSFKPQTAPGKSNPLEYWFYPANTVILSVPKSKDAAETYELLKPLANGANLITLGSVLPDFGQNLDQETRFYFVDETGRLPKKMGDKNSIPFGSVQVTRSYTGMKGPYDVTETLDVFAMKPGYYD